MKVPPVKVVFSEQDREEILRRIDECLASGMLAQGKNVKEFEDEFAKSTGTKHAVAVSSGGSALEIAMRILNVTGKEVLVPANTFLATASSVVLAGGKVKFVDVAPDTFSVSLENLRKAATKNTAGVIVVHIGGIITPEIEKIQDWCRAQKLWLFEDCAHAHGSKWHGKASGNFGIAGGYSFFSTKVMTSGEGGMVVTHDDDFAKKARVFRDYGKPEPWVSFHTEMGANWRMSDIAGAVGVVQLKRLQEFVSWREKIANSYTRLLKSIPNITPVLPKDRCSWYKYIVLLPKGADREILKAKMKESGVSLSGGVYEIPLHRQPVFKETAANHYPVAEDICGRHICLPIYYGITNEEAEYVVQTLKNVLSNLTIKTKEVIP